MFYPLLPCHSRIHAIYQYYPLSLGYPFPFGVRTSYKYRTLQPHKGRFFRTTTFESSGLGLNVDRGKDRGRLSWLFGVTRSFPIFSPRVTTLSSLLRTLAALKPCSGFCGRCCEAGDEEAGEGEGGGGGGEGASRGERSSSSSVIVIVDR